MPTQQPKNEQVPEEPPIADVNMEQTPLDGAKQRTAELVDPRIAGGIPATIEDFPWQVVLIDGAAPPEIRSAFCGGSLIGYQWVMTAAHCLAGISDPSQVDIVCGSTWPKFAGQGDRVKIIKIFVHQKYNNKTYENDIALLKLERPAKKGRSIALPPMNLIIPSNTAATVTGWGAVTAYGPMVDRLLKAPVPIVSIGTCRDSYGDIVKDGMLCAGERDGGLDACQGDSGGPLTTKISGKATIVGVVSWGRGCALKKKYGSVANL